VLNLAGWLALLIGCVEYDQGDRRASETTREVALSLGSETGDPDIVGWVHEMRAWIALTTGDYRGAIYASRTGMEAAGGRPVAAQLASQAAKAWARVGDRRQTEVALDQGRSILAGLPYPDNLDNHFVVDPANPCRGRGTRRRHRCRPRQWATRVPSATAVGATLIMVGHELRRALDARYPGDLDVAEFTQTLRNLTPVG
jgi:hypothetical protein